MKAKIAIVVLAFVLLLASAIDAVTYAGDGANLWQYEQPRLSLAVVTFTEQPIKRAVFSPLPTPTLSPIPTPRFKLH